MMNDTYIGSFSFKSRLGLLLLFFLCSAAAPCQRLMEPMNRGVVAIADGGGKVFVSWRLLAADPDNIAFNLYRKTGNHEEKLNKAPLAGATSFLDEAPGAAPERIYIVKPVLNGRELPEAGRFVLRDKEHPFLSVPISIPDGYAANDASVGDLDGDGVYEIVLHVAGKGHDNSHAGFTDPPLIQAYKLDGTLLWTINLGKNIREGAHYTQFMVYDLDGDGKAEVAMKTADGARDGKGRIIGDSTKDWRNDKGYILAGPEYLTVFDGQTGAAIHTVGFVPPRSNDSLTPTPEALKAIWGDGYGNRMDRFLAAIAYLDGVHPSLVMTRGYYTRTVIAAWDLKNKKLQQRWVFDTNDRGNGNYAGQGNHNLSIADVDGDGRDEIVYGAMCVDDNGKGLYSTGLGHGDALHVSDLDPSIPGLEVFDIQERFDDAGCSFRSAATGAIYWKKPSVKAGEDGEGPGRGLALDVDPRYPGAECWVAGAGIRGMFDCKGNKIEDRTPACNMGILWDGDLLAEILSGTNIDKWDYMNQSTNRILSAAQYQCRSNNGTKATPVLVGDILGDWREEVIYSTVDNKELRIFSTTAPTQYRFYTLMQDPQYRLSIAWQNVGYNQPPHTSFFFGDGMKPPPKPDIKSTRQ
ncbi:rhamnogalacturonan lyase [Niabella hirudinis]|uniref:rhamnogalacturonan lyase n=1 Tax=Niabella hirudinis TaxID=1285929 RepID=UPI003EBF5796